MNQKGISNIALIILVVVFVGVAGYFALYNRSATPAPTSDITSLPASGSIPPPTPTPSDFYEITPQDFDLECLGVGGSQEFVVRTQAEYQHLIDISPDLYPNPSLLCVDYEFPVIDFFQMTLLGKAITGSGCSSEVKKKTLRNDNDREVIYSITSTFKGVCEMAISDNNFILVPKIPENYTVKFEVNSQSEF